MEQLTLGSEVRCYRYRSIKKGGPQRQTSPRLGADIRSLTTGPRPGRVSVNSLVPVGYPTMGGVTGRASTTAKADW